MAGAVVFDCVVWLSDRMRDGLLVVSNSKDVLVQSRPS